jgi:mannose-6-phosphate isomerase
MQIRDKILKLKGKVQHYDWGGFDFIPSTLKIKTIEGKPFAEYWMGAHKSASAEVEVNGEFKVLNELIKQDPSLFIGEKTFDQFAELPYLFKILDVREMLSIQVHPTKEEAIKGFEAEEKAGVAINAFNRNYKDKNHKPEVMVALSDFWLLHGFKPEQQLKSTLEQVAEFNFLLPLFEEKGYYSLYKNIMEMPQQKVDEVLIPLIQKCLNESAPSKEVPSYWVRKLYANRELQNIDRGVFSIYFFNIVKLYPGEGIFQAAGIPHAYLEGQNVELMANSDNVLRGGLTSKYIDVNELLKHTSFTAVEPQVLRGDLIASIEWNYPCPVEDFGISAFQLKKGQQYQSKSFSAEIFIMISGSITINGSHLISGESCFILAQTDYQFVAEADCLLYKAFVPFGDKN